MQPTLFRTILTSLLLLVVSSRQPAAFQFPSNPSFFMYSNGHETAIRKHWEREKGIYDTIKHSIKPSSSCVFLDIGADHGTFTLFAASLGCDVIAVERDKTLADTIRRSVDMNRLNARVRVMNHAAATKGVDTTRVDRLLGDTKTIVTFMKIDVQGHELRVLDSAFGLTSSKRVQNIIAEFGPTRRWFASTGDTVQYAEQVIRDLSLHGYSIRLMRTHNPVQCYEAMYRQEHVTIPNQDGSALLIPHAKIGEFIHIMDALQHQCYVWFALKH